jgi:hypothetical protein
MLVALVYMLASTIRGYSNSYLALTIVLGDGYMLEV